MVTQQLINMLMKANQLFYDCEYVQAIKLYEKCIKMHPQQTDAWSSASTCYLELGFVAKSLSYIEKAMKLEHNCMIAYTNYTAILINLRRIDDAIKCLENALAERNLYDIDYPMIFNNLGYAYELKEDYHTAVFYYEKAIDCDKDDECVIASVNLGNVLYRKWNDKETAFKHYKYAASLGDVDAQAVLFQYKGYWCN